MQGVHGVLVCQTRLKLSCKVDECKPLPRARRRRACSQISECDWWLLAVSWLSLSPQSAGPHHPFLFLLNL